MADIVEIFLTLRNARRFIEDADSSAKAVGHIGDQAEKSGKKASIGWKGIAKWGGGAAVLYGASRYIRGAVSATDDLAKSTLQVQRVTNMDTQTASAWVGVLKERNISSQQFGRSLATFSKQVEVARTGTAAQSTAMAKLHKQYQAITLIGGKGAPAALKKTQAAMDALKAKGDKARAVMKSLGASTLDIAKGNTQQLLLQVADRFRQMKNPIERTALVQKLFGRAGQALLPILLRGRDGIQELLDTQIKYGNVLSGKSIEDTAKFIQQQRDLHAATEGLRVSLGVALMPAISGVVGALLKLVDVFQPLLRQGWLVKTLLGVLAVAFIAYRIAIVAATIASWELSAATWASIGIWVLVAAAIIAVGVGVYVLFKKWKWFHNFILASWQWIKQNWPLLLGIITGPFGLAAAYIITHWTKVKTFVLGIIDAIRQAITRVLNIGKNVVGKFQDIRHKVTGAPGRAAHAIGSLFGGQHGGIVPHQANVLVGEVGPELLSLPGGATITPLPQIRQLGLAGAGGSIEIVVPVYLNARQIARAVAQVSADKLARR